MTQEPLTYEFLSKQYHPLACKMARKFMIPGKVEYDDLLQEAQLAFLEVVKDYEPSRGELKHYVYIRVLGALSQYNLFYRNQVKLPNQIAKGISLLAKIRKEILSAGKEEHAIEIINNFKHPEDTPAIKEQKRKLKNLAKNSKHTYKSFLTLLIEPIEYYDESPPAHQVSNWSWSNKLKESRISDENSYNPTDEIIDQIDREKELKLLNELSSFNRALLVLRAKDFEYDEIVDLLHKTGLLKKRYTRQACKSAFNTAQEQFVLLYKRKIIPRIRKSMKIKSLILEDMIEAINNKSPHPYINHRTKEIHLSDEHYQLITKSKYASIQDANHHFHGYIVVFHKKSELANLLSGEK